MYKLKSLLFRSAFAAALVFSLIVPARAAEMDLTAFGGIHQQGKLSLQNAQNAIQNINSTTFAVIGARFGHGGVIGGEHTLAYSGNFIDADTKAFIYNSNLRIQAKFPVVRPYGTAGLGLIYTSGSGVGVFGTRFAVNYGGGVKILPAGPVGLAFDIRGYSIPSTEFNVFATESQTINFMEASFGVVFKFGK